MSKLLIESLNADLPALAEMIRAKGRGRDTVLAHITPKEAALLKRRGGRGSINPDTGLPEFEEFEQLPAETLSNFSDLYANNQLPQEGQATIYSPDAGPQYVPEAQSYDQYATPAAPAPAATPTAPAEAPKGPDYSESQFRQAAAGQEPDKPFLERAGDALSKFLTDPANLAKLGILGGLGAFGARQGTQASQQAQAAVQQVRDIIPQVQARSDVAQQQFRDIGRGITEQTRINAAELAALGAPQRELGLQLMSQAQSGTLTPAGQRALNALKAQARQNITKRGGVGAMQAGVAESEAEANLLQQQLQQGLGTYQQGAQYAASAIGMNQAAIQAANNMQVAAINTALQQGGIADQYTINAINLGLASDKATAQSLQNFYSQLASVGFGQTSAALKPKFDAQTGQPIA